MEKLILLRALLQSLLPKRMFDRALLANRSPRGEHVVGNGEFLVLEAEFLAGRRDLVLAKRRAMRRCRALLVRSAIADDRLAADQARPWISKRFLDGAVHVVGIEPVAFAGVPLRRLVTGDNVLVARQVGRAVDRDVVVV